MNSAVLEALLSHWRQRPLQFVTLMLGLALATALWTGVQAINAEARQSYARAAELLAGGGQRELYDPTGSEIPLATYTRLRRAGWLVTPVIDGRLKAEGGWVQLLGSDPLSMPGGTPLGGLFRSGPKTTIGSGAEVLAAPRTAVRLKEAGTATRATRGIAPGLAIADIAVARKLTGAEGFSRLILLPDQPLNRPTIASVAPGLKERVAGGPAADLGGLTYSFHLNLTAFGLLSFAVGMFIVNGAVGLAFEQRRPMFRTLRTLGVPARRLVTLLVTELLLIALLAGTLGTAAGYLVAAALLPNVAASLRGLYGASVDGSLTLPPVWWLWGVAIAILGTVAAAAGGLVRAARIQPLAAAKPRAWALLSKTTIRWQLVASALCFALALGAWLSHAGLIAGFILLGGLLFGFAFALPAFLSLCLHLAACLAQGPVAEWFWADARQQIPALSLALTALLLALATNIGVNTMVKSFRETFTDWLDQRLVSALYITAPNEADVPRLVAFLKPRVDAVLPNWRIRTDILGAPGEIRGVVDDIAYRQNWPVLSAVPGVWSGLFSGKGVLINEQIAHRHRLENGNTIAMPGGWTAEILGIYSDYGNPYGQVIVPMAALVAHYPDADRRDFGVRVAPSKVADLKAALVDGFGLPPGNLVDQASLKAFSLSVFERTFAVTAVLNVLTLGVSGVAILTSLLTLAAMRLPQLAPLWALGLTRAYLGRIEVLRALLLAALTWVLAVPAGLTLAWALLSVVNVEAFGWRLPMHFYPTDWAVLGVMSLLAAGLAGLWPARRLATRPPSELIAVFTYER